MFNFFASAKNEPFESFLRGRESLEIDLDFKDVEAFTLYLCILIVLSCF